MLYFTVNDTDFEPPDPEGAIAYTEQATRGVTYTRWDGLTITRTILLNDAQRLASGRLIVNTGEEVGQLTTAEKDALVALLEAATHTDPVHVETNCVTPALDGWFTLEPGTSVTTSAVTRDTEYHAWGATLVRVPDPTP